MACSHSLLSYGIRTRDGTVETLKGSCACSDPPNLSIPYKKKQLPDKLVISWLSHLPSDLGSLVIGGHHMVNPLNGDAGSLSVQNERISVLYLSYRSTVKTIIVLLKCITVSAARERARSRGGGLQRSLRQRHPVYDYIGHGLGGFEV